MHGFFWIVEFCKDFVVHIDRTFSIPNLLDSLFSIVSIMSITLALYQNYLSIAFVSSNEVRFPLFKAANDSEWG